MAVAKFYYSSVTFGTYVERMNDQSGMAAAARLGACTQPCGGTCAMKNMGIGDKSTRVHYSFLGFGTFADRCESSQSANLAVQIRMKIKGLQPRALSCKNSRAQVSKFRLKGYEKRIFASFTLNHEFIT